MNETNDQKFLNKNKEKLFLMKKKMEEHSDKNTFLNINNLIKKIYLKSPSNLQLYSNSPTHYQTKSVF